MPIGWPSVFLCLLWLLWLKLPQLCWIIVVRVVRCYVYFTTTKILKPQAPLLIRPLPFLPCSPALLHPSSPGSATLFLFQLLKRPSSLASEPCLCLLLRQEHSSSFFAGINPFNPLNLWRKLADVHQPVPLLLGTQLDLTSQPPLQKIKIINKNQNLFYS